MCLAALEAERDLKENPHSEPMRRVIAHWAGAYPAETLHETLPIWEAVFADDPDMLRRFAEIPRRPPPRPAGELEEVSSEDDGPGFLRDLGYRVESHDDRYWRVYRRFQGAKLFWTGCSYFPTKEAAWAYAERIEPQLAKLRLELSTEGRSWART
jgi:hypothetical protein